MSPIKYKSITTLEDNSIDIYMTCTEVLLRIARNILNEPQNPKYRTISLGSNTVTNKLLPAIGAMECLFDMGFQEGSDKLVLPQECSLENVKYIHDELMKRRQSKEKKKSEILTPENNQPESQVAETSQAQKSTQNQALNPILAKIDHEIKGYMNSINNQFLKNFCAYIIQIWQCESIHVQLKALKCIPLVDLKVKVAKNIRQIQLAIKKKEIDDEIIDFQEILLLELCKWFKNEFFHWVNTPECTHCGNKETTFVQKKTDSTEGNITVEIYKCSFCGSAVLFPRIQNAEKLLDTRKGRCGEWAKCFYLFCRSLGYDARFVVDATDHVWVEVYSSLRKQWVHCDPCETVIDAPLMYECGWKKNLSYIIAYSKDEIQDVTWRYSCNHFKVLKNRKNCSEDQLVDMICNIRKILLSFASQKRREFVMKRAALELVDLLVQKSVREFEKQGRSSGSLAWRLARGEITLAEKFAPYIWKLKKVAGEKKFTLSYCTSADEYVLNNEHIVIKGWRNGLFNVNSIFRKEEQDWKIVYLARKEGTSKGSLTWRFQAEEGFVIGDVEVILINQVFENGQVISKLCSNEKCVKIPNDKAIFSTSCFKGCNNIELYVELSGGNGENAWQHAQILRQSFNASEKTFQITLNLEEPTDG